MTCGLRILIDSSDPEYPISLATTHHGKTKRTLYFHMTSDDALRLAYRLMALAHTQDVGSEVFERTEI